MKPRDLMVALSAAALLAAPVAGQQEDEGATNADPFAELRASFVTAYNAGNAAGVASHFAMDGTLLLPDGSAVTGREPIHHAYHDVFEDWSDQTLDVTQRDLHIFDDHAFARGEYRITASPAEGTGSITIDGHYANALRKQADGTWKITWHIVTGPGERRAGGS